MISQFPVRVLAALRVDAACTAGSLPVAVASASRRWGSIDVELLVVALGAVAIVCGLSLTDTVVRALAVVFGPRRRYR